MKGVTIIFPGPFSVNIIFIQGFDEFFAFINGNFAIRNNNGLTRKTDDTFYIIGIFLKLAFENDDIAAFRFVEKIGQSGT